MFIHGRFARWVATSQWACFPFPRCLGWGRLECSDFRILRSYQENICKYVSLKKEKEKAFKARDVFLNFPTGTWRLTFTSHWLESLRTAPRNPAARQKESIKRWSNRHSQIRNYTRMSLITGFYLAPFVVRLDFPGAVRDHLIFLFSVFSFNTYLKMCSLFGAEECFF